MIVRPLKSGEEDDVAALAQAAFRVGVAAPGEREHAHWLRYYTENPHVTDGDTIVVENSGKIVGAATALRFEMSFGGVDVPMRGFAAVVVAPEARRQRVADRMMRELLIRLRESGEAITMLRPFRMPFYRKFGFGSCESFDLLRVAPAQLPDSEHRMRVRVYNARYNYDPLERVYDHARSQNFRSVGALKRSAYWWKERVLRNTPEVVVFEDARGVTGYAIYEVPSVPEYPRQECRVKELIATTPESFRGLVGFFHALGDQYRVIDLPLPRGEGAVLAMDHGLVDAPASLFWREAVGYLHTMNMARLLDVPKALAMHPFPARRSTRGELGLDIDDPLENKPISFDVTFEGGAHAVAEARAKDRLALGMDRLAQIYFGAARAVDLHARGFISGSLRAAELLDDALHGLDLFGGPLNAF